MSETFFPFILEPSWQEALESELKKPYLIKLAAFLEIEYAKYRGLIHPPKELIFNAFSQTPFSKVKVVLMGQDPYHGEGQAHGLSFSVPIGVKPPPSLQNIFKELKEDIGFTIPSHGCLIPWAQQGVLLLNATLTVRNAEAHSHHGMGWEQFTDAVIQKLIERKDPLLFVLWGKFAQEKCRFLKESKSAQHHAIIAAHPSPFSAHNGFFGCRHFSQINQWLTQHGKDPINWAI